MICPPQFQGFGFVCQVIRPKIMQLVEQRLTPEFINRIDEIIMFNRLKRENIAGIVQIMLKNVASMLEDQEIELNVSPEAVQELVTSGFSHVYGARPLKRLIQTKLLNNMARMILDGSVLPGETINVDKRDGQIVVVPNHDAAVQHIDEDEDE